MDIQEQSGLRAVLSGTPLPKVCLVRQRFSQDGILDPAAVLSEKLAAVGFAPGCGWPSPEAAVRWQT